MISRTALLRPFSSPFGLFAFASTCSVSRDGKKLNLQCDGEDERRYHGVWLRHNCTCPICLSSSTKQTIVHHSSLIDLRIKDATLKGENIKVNWDSKVGPHSCSFNVDWLKKHDYTTPQLRVEKMEQEEPLFANSFPTADYNEVMSSSEGYYKWMKQINYYGVTLLQNVPTVERELVKVTNIIAAPQVTSSQEVFQVKAKGDLATDAAYTSNELLLHSDQNFYESSPGVEFLFCLQFDDCVEGGESNLVDAYPVLKQFRKEYPKQFEVLTRVPYIVKRAQDDVGTPLGFKYSHPHISLDSNEMINFFSWSPQYHCPLNVSEKDTEDYYEAFTLLSAMFEESPLKFTHRLKPGEALLFNNRRVLHSRNGFKLNGGTRHLQSHYIDIDVFLSKFRLLSKELNKQDPVKRMFNRCYSF